MKWVSVIVLGLLVVGYCIGMRLLNSYTKELKGKDISDIVKEYNKAIKVGKN